MNIMSKSKKNHSPQNSTEETKIDGRPAIVSYLDRDRNPVDKSQAVFSQIYFTDTNESAFVDMNDV